jgi:hypothetical protein
MGFGAGVYGIEANSSFYHCENLSFRPNKGTFAVAGSRAMDFRQARGNVEYIVWTIFA